MHILLYTPFIAIPRKKNNKSKPLDFYAYLGISILKNKVQQIQLF